MACVRSLYSGLAREFERGVAIPNPAEVGVVIEDFDVETKPDCELETPSDGARVRPSGIS